MWIEHFDPAIKVMETISLPAMTANKKTTATWIGALRIHS